MTQTSAAAAAVAQGVASASASASAPAGRDALLLARGDTQVVREVRHSDGKVERSYASGKRIVEFANRTRKVCLPDGSSRVLFANGDIKWVLPAPDGPVHYYYAQVNTWHTTYPQHGVEVFYFPSGQTEAHHPSGHKEILFPDGVMRVVLASGEEVDANWQQLSWAVKQPQPRVPEFDDLQQ